MTNTTNGILPLDFPVTFEPVRYKSGERKGQVMPGALRVVTPGWAVQINTRSWASHSKSREFFAATRVYDALGAFVPGFDAEETRLLNAITDHSVKDPALARFQRASARTASERLAVVLPELLRILRAFGFQVTGDAAPLSAKFSRKAGCSMCPCSPGHVVSERITVNGSGVDMWFDEALPPVEAEATV